MSIGDTVRRLVGLSGKSESLTVSDAKMARLWGRLFGFGDTAAGKSVTPDSAMQVSAFWACVKLLAETIATLPLTIYRREADGGRVTASDHPLSMLLRVTPDGEHTAVEFWEGAVLSLCLHGDAFAEKVRSGGGRLIALQAMRADLTTVRRVWDGSVEYRYADPLGARTLAESDVFHLRAFGSAGLRGLSPLMFARQTVSASIAADEWANKLFSNGVRPSGVLEVGQILKKEQRTDLLENVVKPLAGSSNAHGVFVLEGGMKFTPISLSPADSQLLETRRWHVEEICRWFGVPPILIGHASQGQTMWGTGVEQIALSWLTLGLRSQLRRIEAAISLRLIEPAERTTVYAEFAVEGLLRADSEARAKLYASFAQNGIMDRDEIREKENLNRRGGGAGKLTVQSNLLPIDDLGLVAQLPREKPVEDGSATVSQTNPTSANKSGSLAEPSISLKALAAVAALMKAFNPDQPRAADGKWGSGGGSSSGGGGGGEAAERAEFKRTVLLTVAGAATIAGVSAITALSGGTAPAAVAAVGYIAENFMLAEALNTSVKRIAERSGLDAEHVKSILNGTLDKIGVKAESKPDLGTAKVDLTDLVNVSIDSMLSMVEQASNLTPERLDIGRRTLERVRKTFLDRIAAV